MGNDVNDAGTSGLSSAMAQKPLGGRFETALWELINICHDGGLHASEMVGPLRAALMWAEQNKR